MIGVHDIFVKPELRLKPCLVVMIMATRLIPTPDLPLHTQDKYPTEFRLSKDQNLLTMPMSWTYLCPAIIFVSTAKLHLYFVHIRRFQ